MYHSNVRSFVVHVRTNPFVPTFMLVSCNDTVLIVTNIYIERGEYPTLIHPCRNA